jgi:hypothetical protein
MNFASRQVKNAVSDVGAVVVLQLSRGNRDYSEMIKTGGIYAGSKYIYDLVKPTVESAVRSAANSVFGRAADFVIEVVSTAAIYYVLETYIFKRQVDLVNMIWTSLLMNPMADKFEDILN